MLHKLLAKCYICGMLNLSPSTAGTFQEVRKAFTASIVRPPCNVCFLQVLMPAFSNQYLPCDALCLSIDYVYDPYM